MNVWQRLFKKAVRRTSIFFNETARANWPQSMRDYEGISDEGYQQCAEVYACINLLSHTAKGVAWNLYTRQKRGKKLVEIEDNEHPYLKLIRRPNPYQSWGKFIENLVGYYKVSGNAFIYRNGPSNKQPPQELWLLRPDRVSVVPSKNPLVGPVHHYDYTINDKTESLAPDRNVDFVPWHIVKHLKTFNPLDDLYGLSPIRAGARTVDQINEAMKLNYGLLKNGARIGGVFISKNGDDEDQEASLKRQLTESYSGAQNAGKQLLVTGDLEWKEMGMKPKDMDWLQGQQMNTRRICSVFGVSPELIGDAQNKTYNNQKEARRALYVEAVMPLLDELQDEFNSWLSPLFGDNLLLCYDKDDIEAVKDEREAIWGRVISAVNAGVITPNEGREAIGYEASNDAKADILRTPVAKPNSKDPLQLDDPSDKFNREEIYAN